METPDYTLLAAALAGLHEDYASTRRNLESGGEEHNSMLGEHPSKARLRNYFAGIGATGTAMAAMAQKSVSRPVLAGVAAMEFMLAHQNKQKDAPKEFTKAMQKPLLVGLMAALAAHSLLGEDSPVGLSATKDGAAITFKKRF